MPLRPGGSPAATGSAQPDLSPNTGEPSQSGHLTAAREARQSNQGAVATPMCADSRALVYPYDTQRPGCAARALATLVTEPPTIKDWDGGTAATHTQRSKGWRSCAASRYLRRPLHRPSPRGQARAARRQSRMALGWGPTRSVVPGIGRMRSDSAGPAYAVHWSSEIPRARHSGERAPPSISAWVEAARIDAACEARALVRSVGRVDNFLRHLALGPAACNHTRTNRPVERQRDSGNGIQQRAVEIEQHRPQALPAPVRRNGVCIERDADRHDRCT